MDLRNSSPCGNACVPETFGERLRQPGAWLLQVRLRDWQAWNLRICFTDCDGSLFSRKMIRIDAENTYFRVGHAHEPISDLYLTSAVADEQFHLRGGHYFLPEGLFFYRRAFFYRREWQACHSFWTCKSQGLGAGTSILSRGKPATWRICVIIFRAKMCCDTGKIDQWTQGEQKSSR